MNDEYDIVEVSELLRNICINSKSSVCINYKFFDRDTFSNNRVYISDMTFRRNDTYLYISILKTLELNNIPYIEKRIKSPNSRYYKYIIEINI